MNETPTPGGKRPGEEGRKIMARTPEHIRRRFEIHYRSIYGGFGIVGWVTFKKKDEAERYAETFKNSTPWVAEAWVDHPAVIYSNY